MPYATPTTVREALAPEGDSTQATAAGLNNAQLSDAIVEATSEVDARLAPAPFADPVPAIVAAITRDIAAYLATLTHRRGNPLPQGHPVLLRYQRAEQLLGQGAAGNLELGEIPTEGSEVQVATQFEGSLWTLDGEGIGPSPYRAWPGYGYPPGFVP